MMIIIVNMKKLNYNKLPLYVLSILFTSILLILSLRSYHFNNNRIKF